MQIKIRLIGAFRIGRFKEQDIEYKAGTFVKEIVHSLDISERVLGIILINGRPARMEDPLKDGDTVALLPILGGG